MLRPNDRVNSSLIQGPGLTFAAYRRRSQAHMTDSAQRNDLSALARRRTDVREDDRFANTLRVLVADDDHDYSAYLSVLLRGLGFRVTAVHDGVEAIKELESEE